ncbi:hypothetical protein EIP86_003503 [Pleurotus ostreatoroseus]|nr:hypothetical protein EIP86_003503 [Pleurotus ostreatoroseus]
MPPRRFEVPEYMQHSTWRGEDSDELKGGLVLADLDVKPWVVKFQWKSSDGGTAQGTGFIVNIPGSSHDVILTAAHNLIDANGVWSNDLEAHISREAVQQSSPSSPSSNIIKVDQSALRICDEYRTSKGTGTDWGAVLLQKGTIRAMTGTDKSAGFGYSMRLAYKDLKEDVYVTGFRASSTGNGDELTTKTSSGPCRTYSKYLQYQAKTEQGISGSPVWFAYEGEPVVVAIHNMRPPKEGAGSRGARLTTRLLRVVFEWAQVGKYNVQLRTKDLSPELPKKGLFLYFREGDDLARVKIESGSSFDVLPAQTRSGDPNPKLVRSAMSLGDRWVYFNGRRSEVRLEDELKDGCFFTETNSKPKKMQIATPAIPEQSDRQDKTRYQLKVQRQLIDNLDEDDEDTTSPEVFMVQYPASKKEQFIWFSFE